MKERIKPQEKLNEWVKKQGGSEGMRVVLERIKKAIKGER